MEKKVHDFINMDTDRYLSLKFIKVFYWCISIIWLCMIVFWIVGKVLFSLVFSVSWSLLYWLLVCVLQSKRIKKTFDLRFLVNGIAGVMTSALFWGIFTTIQILLSNQPSLRLDHYLWTLLAYLVFSAIFVVLIVLGVHSGFFSKMKRSNMSRRAIALEGAFAVILPFSGLLGMYTSKLLRSQAGANTQIIVANACFLLLIFIPGLAHINFVQYYYCKKYGITCDENGNETSPELCPKAKVNKTKVKTQKENRELVKGGKIEATTFDRKHISTQEKILRSILILLVCIASLFVLVFLVFFVKSIISKM